MLPVEDGICYLTLVTGFFHNRNEDVAKVYILGEHWYLGGGTSKYETGAEATCWRFPAPAGHEALHGCSSFSPRS